MITIIGSIQTRPDTHKRMLMLGIEHSVRSRQEQGCIAHHCLVDTETPSRLVFVEHWTDMNAVQAHFAVAETGAFVQEMAALGSTPPEIRLFDCDEVPAPNLA